MMTETTAINLRGISMTLVCYTRALRLCARMNRETEVLDFIDAIPRGSVLYDLGSCEGRFAIYAASRGIRVFAFEPEEQNFLALTENLALNPQAREFLRPFRCAVGRRTESALLRIGQPWAGGHQRVLAAGSGRFDLAFPEVSTQTVDVVALDEFIAANRLPSPDFLKVDVDGSELAFLDGAQQTLARPELRAMIFELCKDDEGYPIAIERLAAAGLHASEEYVVEPGLYNVVFSRRNTDFRTRETVRHDMD